MIYYGNIHILNHSYPIYNHRHYHMNEPNKIYLLPCIQGILYKTYVWTYLNIIKNI